MQEQVPKYKQCNKNQQSQEAALKWSAMKYLLRLQVKAQKSCVAAVPVRAPFCVVSPLVVVDLQFRYIAADVAVARASRARS